MQEKHSGPNFTNEETKSQQVSHWILNIYYVQGASVPPQPVHPLSMEITLKELQQMKIFGEVFNKKNQTVNPCAHSQWCAMPSGYFSAPALSKLRNMALIETGFQLLSFYKNGYYTVVTMWKSRLRLGSGFAPSVFYKRKYGTQAIGSC